MSVLQMVKSFYVKFQQPVKQTPGWPEASRLQERINFMQEELTEFGEACELKDMELAFDALIDLEYVLLGTAIEMGLGGIFFDGFTEVHRANMVKVIGTTHRGIAIDVTKPEGWVPPQLEKILLNAGWVKPAPTQGDFKL
ncbi:MAG: hypothetical protein PHU06_06240 [Gallionella sp.]|nr:hypothetical protein [Gallionella sp.]MDD4958435.1 hypothetical protein [Gallionella sp.]